MTLAGDTTVIYTSHNKKTLEGCSEDVKHFDGYIWCCVLMLLSFCLFHFVFGDFGCGHQSNATGSNKRTLKVSSEYVKHFSGYIQCSSLTL